jgi:hypothetical protein
VLDWTALFVRTKKLLDIDLEVLRALLDIVIAARAVDRPAGREPGASFSSPTPTAMIAVEKSRMMTVR